MDPDDELYIPEAISIGEGEVVILDPLGFELEYNTMAILVRGGELWYLDKDSRQWVNVETKGGKKTVRSVQ